MITDRDSIRAAISDLQRAQIAALVSHGVKATVEYFDRNSAILVCRSQYSGKLFGIDADGTFGKL